MKRAPRYSYSKPMRGPREKHELIFVINRDNAENLSNLMRVFGMASERHRKDTVRILGLILGRV